MLWFSGWPLDWSTVLVLAGITVLEGLRRVPAGAFVLRATSRSRWTVAQRVADDRWTIISWASPLILKVVIPPATGNLGPVPFARRWRRIRRWLPVLRLLGLGTWVFVVFGIPLATGKLGALGFLLGVLLAVEAALLLTILSAFALDHAGVPVPVIRRGVFPLLSPFAAPRAPEAVAETALNGVPTLVALRKLITGTHFQGAIRMRAYDMLRCGASDQELVNVLSMRRLQAIIESPPEGHTALADAAFCPRCAQTFHNSVTVCSDCDGVSLFAHPGNAHS